MAQCMLEGGEEIEGLVGFQKFKKMKRTFESMKKKSLKIIKKNEKKEFIIKEKIIKK